MSEPIRDTRGIKAFYDDPATVGAYLNRRTTQPLNSVLHEPFMNGAINSPKDELSATDLYQAIHHELVASALATRIAHETMPDAKVGWRDYYFEPMKEYFARMGKAKRAHAAPTGR